VSDLVWLDHHARKVGGSLLAPVCDGTMLLFVLGGGLTYALRLICFYAVYVLEFFVSFLVEASEIWVLEGTWLTHHTLDVWKSSFLWFLMPVLISSFSFRVIYLLEVDGVYGYRWVRVNACLQVEEALAFVNFIFTQEDMDCPF
jgi:hypothetical protein